MGFSILSWNVEKFDGETTQLNVVSDHIKSINGNNQTGPDVFGLFEVENINIIDLISNKLPGYDYYLTDGPQNKEILLGVRHGKFEQVTFSQKREFKAYNPYLRPGAFLTLKLSGDLFNVLFLHTDSGTEAKDFGNRDEMFGKVWNLKKAVDKGAAALGVASKLLVLGDLNTMGLLFPTRRKSDRRVTQDEEIEALADKAKKRDTVLLFKEFASTFTDLKITSDLDHILATDNLQFNQLGQRDGKPFFVRVTGWQQLQGDKQKDFVENISDHCSLYCEFS